MGNKKILIACEESQVVTLAFRKLGYEAYSCDLQPCSGGHSEWHLQQDVTQLLSDSWAMIIAFPPCTHLTCSGARWFKKKQADGRQQKAIDFFMLFVNNPCQYIAIENPVGIMSTRYRRPNQIIHPWQFGDPIKKQTCLWLKNLPRLKTTHNKMPKDDILLPDGRQMSKFAYETFNLHGKERRQTRSKTFPGIAKAMAEQWSILI